MNIVLLVVLCAILMMFFHRIHLNFLITKASFYTYPSVRNVSISFPQTSAVKLSALSGWKMSKNRLGLRMFVTWLQKHNKHPTFNAQVAGLALIRSFFKIKRQQKVLLILIENQKLPHIATAKGWIIPESSEKTLGIMINYLSYMRSDRGDYMDLLYLQISFHFQVSSHRPLGNDFLAQHLGNVKLLAARKIIFVSRI